MFGMFDNMKEKAAYLIIGAVAGFLLKATIEEMLNEEFLANEWDDCVDNDCSR